MRSTRVGTANERFSARYQINHETGCWDWVGHRNSKGYGVIAGVVNGKRYVPKGAQMLAHRVSWLIHRGDIPESTLKHGVIVMHKCDNPSCVNPDHLMLGTQADNVRDMIQKGRKVVGEWQKRRGVEHFRSVIKNQSDVDLICSTNGKTQELAEKFGVSVSTINRLRARNGAAKTDAKKYANKKLSDEAIQHIRSTPPGTRGLGKLYGVGKTTIANIRKGLTYAHSS